MKFTKRNHYNPCFWTALWSEDYYRQFLKCQTHSLTPRNQMVFALNVKSGQIHKSKVDNIHYDKNLGVAEISKKAAEDFVKKYHPDQLEYFINENENSEYPVYIDFEDILTGIENMPPYKFLLQIAKKRQIETLEEKTYIGCFIILQQMRSHAIMNASIQFHKELRESKFEHFVTLKWMLSDTKFLFSLVYPLVECQWSLFATNGSLFPLCDSPILLKPHSVMVALSPELLLEIERTIPACDNVCQLKKKIEKAKLDEFRRRTIGNTFREIIGNETILKKWKDTQDFNERVKVMKNLQSYNRIICKEGNKELWHINPFGNRG